MLGIVFLDQDYDQEGVNNINGAIFVTLTTMTFVNIFCILQVGK